MAHRLFPRPFSPRPFSTRPKPTSSNLNVALYMTAIVVGVVGGTYASVPLYKVFCRRTGFGGTTQRVEWEEVKEPSETKGKKKSAFLEKIYKMSNAPEFQKAGHGGVPSGGGQAATWTDSSAEERLKTLQVS